MANPVKALFKKTFLVIGTSTSQFLKSHLEVVRIKSVPLYAFVVVSKFKVDYALW